MQLCSQCQFIYEDDQERCDMDGAELIYEPTLDHVFPEKASDTAAELQRPEPLKLVVPLSPTPKNESLQTSSNEVPARRKVLFKIAACVLTAVVAFIVFMAVRSLLRPRPQTSTNISETQTSKLLSSAIASADALPSDKPEALTTSPETSSSPDKLERQPVIRESVIQPLPGLKPLPRLKPLPTLKPLPRLAERNATANTNRKSVVVSTKPAETKKESRLGSFLKKTGRVLTRPFKS